MIFFFWNIVNLHFQGILTVYHWCEAWSLQILTLFRIDLASNSSCSVEPIPYSLKSLCIILCFRVFVLHGWPAFLRDLNELVSLQTCNIQDTTDLEWPTSLAIAESVIPLAFIWITTCRRVSVTLEWLAISVQSQWKLEECCQLNRVVK